MKSIILLCLVAVGLATLDVDKTLDGPRVVTPLGGIRGFYDYTQNGRKYMAFEGIPYARAPIEDLRFKPPQKIKPWTGDLIAIKTGSPCTQYIHEQIDTRERIIGAEDCLYLNIYKPVIELTKKIPVIIWIHGGAFQWHMEANDGQFTRPDYLMDRDVIFVSFSYRVGPLGFLSTGDDHISGNMGLKDQSMAIRWVNENIEAFGGDSENISLFGLSAGGVSVHYHYLTPLSRGLFKRGISFSGTALNSWGITEEAAEKGKKVAIIVGCPSLSTEEMVKCLRARPARQIALTVMHFMPWLYNPMTPFGPVVEKPTSESPFITSYPIDIINNNEAYDAPWITGVVSEEGLYPGAEFCANEKLLKELDARWDALAPFILDYNYTIPLSKQVQVGRKIRRHYIGDKQIDDNTAMSIIHMIGDRLYTADSIKAAKLMAKKNKNPVFYYYFTYKGAESVSHVMTRTKKDWGVAHGDDSYFVIASPAKNPTTTVEDRSMQRELLDFWISFATCGIPDFGIEWKPVNPSTNKLNYLHIYGPGEKKKNEDDDLGQIKLWSEIDFNENKIISTTKPKI
ncbi:carboxylic ester hydrolase [Microplitis demolitor]|uniref:carboxylic ester hydrolase n=1 Tax=Microplitis demolitor TaxID=69319 RepID=UPI0004CCA710|nr:carboxylic ester hydrolase [Microplitis demolitor]